LGRLKPQPFREIKRRLEKAGFVEVSQKRSHVKFVRRSDEIVDTVVVPKEKHQVPVGTLRNILNQAHINPVGWEISIDHPARNVLGSTQPSRHSGLA
jgi:predicted RNA binding protein YcfA (HicA-like mRNA interferase family)